MMDDPANKPDDVTDQSGSVAESQKSAPPGENAPHTPGVAPPGDYPPTPGVAPPDEDMTRMMSPDVDATVLIQDAHGYQDPIDPDLDNGSLNHSKNHMSSLSPNMAEFGRIPTAPRNIMGNDKTMRPRNSGHLRHPNQMPLVKLSTVTMTNRQRAPSSRKYYNNYVESKSPRKVITWDEATNARPPLRVDMDGPTACSYTPRVKPLYETNAPAWSFGRKTFVEKPGGSRTSWQKTWFQTADVWTQKADFYSDQKWPGPPTHKHKTTVGGRLLSLHTAPRHTFGYKRTSVIEKLGSKEEPAPNNYNIDRANTVILPKSPAYTHSQRWGGTCLWPYTELTPGPGAYTPETSYSRIKTHHPSFSIRGIRREKSHELGPFAAF